MPNTLAHIGVHTGITRGLIRKSELPLIYLGCLIPDAPWILQRVATAVFPSIDRFALRLYAVNQASLVLLLVLCAAVATATQHGRRAFCILALGTLLHLLLDACQIKWANGVSLFVPISWEMLRFDLFWPDSWPTYLLTAAGGIVAFATTKQAWNTPLPLTKQPNRWIAAAALLIAFMMMPFIWVDNAREANNHFMNTLSVDDRIDRYIELDRANYFPRGKQVTLQTYFGQTFNTNGLPIEETSTVSIQGRFANHDTIEVTNHHIHRGPSRDVFSYIGILLIAIVCLRSVYLGLQ